MRLNYQNIHTSLDVLYVYPHYCHINTTHTERKQTRNANLTLKLVFDNSTRFDDIRSNIGENT